MKKVLMVLSEVLTHGGIQRFNRNLVEASIANGDDLYVISLNDAEYKAGIFEKNLANNWVSCKKSKITCIIAVICSLIKNNYDVIFIGHIRLVSIALLIRIFSKKSKVLLIAHGIEIWGRVDSLKKYFILMVDKVLSVSSYTEESIKNQIGNSIDTGVFYNAFRMSPLEGKSVTASGIEFGFKPYALSVTRLDVTEKDKGLEDVIQAFGQLRDIDIHLAIIGDGPYRKQLEDRVDQLGLAEKIHFLGKLSDLDLVDMYKNASIFVLPSRKEGFGIVYLEAMHYGIPVIACAEKGVTDVVHHEKNGLIVPFGDSDAIAAAMRRLAIDKNLAASLIDEGYKYTENEGIFSFAAFKKRYSGIVN